MVGLGMAWWVLYALSALFVYCLNTEWLAGFLIGSWIVAAVFRFIIWPPLRTIGRYGAGLWTRLRANRMPQEGFAEIMAPDQEGRLQPVGRTAYMEVKPPWQRRVS